MSIIRVLKSIFLNEEQPVQKTTSNGHFKSEKMKKAYYELLSQRIKKRQDNLIKLERAVKEMQHTFKNNQTQESHDANLQALSAMIEIEETRLTGEVY